MNARNVVVAAPTLGPREYTWFRERLLQESGIFLSETKGGLVESRLARRLRDLNLSSYAEYIALLETSPDEVREFVEAMTTNKTDFFREAPHFTYLKDEILPTLASKHRELFFWSTASSTGEEVYTLAMTLAEVKDVRYRILGTDLDNHVLDHARAGVYRASLVEAQIPESYRRAHFQRGTGRNSGFYRVNDELKRPIRFAPYNLIQGELPVRTSFDVIFCRNVLIYFQPDTIEVVIRRLAAHLRPGGHLFIGHSESLQNVRHELTQIAPSIFRKKG